MEAGMIIDERFELVSKLGHGGMGAVWKARRIEDNGLVALKFLDPRYAGDEELRTRFRREAAVSRCVGNASHLLDVSDVAEPEDASPYLVMELLDGEDLRSVMKGEAAASRRMEPVRAAELVAQVCEGLAELHGQGIIHRDVKPENIFIYHDGERRERVKLLDFGIVQFRESPDEKPARLSTNGLISCTPHYSAPERLDGQVGVDHRADIYSVGVVLYELLTGRRPFVCRDLREFIMMMVTSDPKAPSELGVDIPKELESVLLRALARDPRKRFQGVDELAAALRGWVQEWKEGRSTVVARHRRASRCPVPETSITGLALPFYRSVKGESKTTLTVSYPL